MPPNPRDNLRHGQAVPLERVREVIANALAPDFLGNPWYRQRLAARVVERLVRYRLLAADVETQCCDLHGRNCEQGGEECCARCTEAHHFAPGHGGVPCSSPDLSGTGAAPCPRDTNGDGDCGRPNCPHCGGRSGEAKITS